LLIRNRQRLVRLDTRLLRLIAKAVLEDLLETREFDLAVHVVRAPEMTRLNETFLQHQGSTDVITFDYSENEPGNQLTPSLHGEIFICIDDTMSQARQFRTSWQSELARYVIHGILHLKGFDDTNLAARREMKREENRVLAKAARRFPLSKLGSGSKLRA
jgi:probable rRNA maturation factor